MDQRSIVPITQLINSVSTSYQDECDRQRQEHYEYLEACWQGPFLYLVPLRSYVVDSELYTKSYEDGQRKDLEAETGDGDVDRRFATPRRLR